MPTLLVSPLRGGSVSPSTTVVPSPDRHTDHSTRETTPTTRPTESPNWRPRSTPSNANSPAAKPTTKRSSTGTNTSSPSPPPHPTPDGRTTTSSALVSPLSPTVSNASSRCPERRTAVDRPTTARSVSDSSDCFLGADAVAVGNCRTNVTNVTTSPVFSPLSCFVLTTPVDVSQWTGNGRKDPTILTRRLCLERRTALG